MVLVPGVIVHGPWHHLANDPWSWDPHSESLLSLYPLYPLIAVVVTEWKQSLSVRTLSTYVPSWTICLFDGIAPNLDERLLNLIVFIEMNFNLHDSFHIIIELFFCRLH